MDRAPPSKAARAAINAALNEAAVRRAYCDADPTRRDAMPLLTELLAITECDARRAIPGWHWP